MRPPAPRPGLTAAARPLMAPRALPPNPATTAPPAAPPARAPPPSLPPADAATLRAGIAQFYDESTGLWEAMWGDQLHHGLYRADDSPHKTNYDAQVDMIDALLSWAGVSNVTRMADVGCGVCGSARHVATAFPGASAVGVTLSPHQASRANALSAAAGLSDRVKAVVGDAVDPEAAGGALQEGAFDLVWSLESGEHMPDKRAFVRRLAALAAPGGRVIVATWVHRDLGVGEEGLAPREEKLLARINRAYFLPPWCSGADYVAEFEGAGLVDVRSEDWSALVAPFWGRVIRSALTLRGVVGLLRAGRKTIKGALAMPLMARGFKRGTIKFVVLTAKRAEA